MKAEKRNVRKSNVCGGDGKVIRKGGREAKKKEQRD